MDDHFVTNIQKTCKHNKIDFGIEGIALWYRGV